MSKDAGDQQADAPGDDVGTVTAASLPRQPAEAGGGSDREGTITVTGSRLRDGDATTRLTVIDAHEIRARGVTSVEELIRTLPQNVATIGAITNNRSRGPLVRNNRPVVSAVGGLGVSAANLGGVGAGNTLVLVNGRRIAGAAGIEQGFANLNGIPLTAIERVEISTGGASAIYGADALGGVINFILKKDFVGTTISAQHERSSGGGEETRIGLYSGTGWGSGNLTVGVDFSRQTPAENSKTGYVTRNYAPRFGGDQRYDFRNLNTGLQPGVIVRPAVYDPETGELLQPQRGFTVRPGLTGVPGPDDFVPVGLDQARDFIPRYLGPSSSSASATLNVEQNVTSKLRLFFNGLYSRVRTTQGDIGLDGINIALAPGQHYNPFGAYEIDGFSIPTVVSYFPASEFADGSLPIGRLKNLSTSWNVNIGAIYDLARGLKLQLVYTGSSSKTSGDGRALGNLVDFIQDDTSPTGYSCFNRQLAEGAVPASQLPSFRAAFARQCNVLTSTDPNVAFNPWKSTSSGGGSSITEFLYLPVVDDLGTTLHNGEGRLTGTAMQLPGGAVDFALGAEYAVSKVQNQQIRNVAGENAANRRYAFFGEATLPIFGRGYDLPLVKQLIFNLAVRHDVTSARGPVGLVDGIPIEKGGRYVYADSRFGATTPAFGVLWSPTAAIAIRARFTRGFKAPPSTELFDYRGSSVSPTTITDDPLYTCTVNCDPDVTGAYTVNSVLAPNPDLKPERSRQQVYSVTWQPSGELSGINLSVSYNRNQLRNQFATLTDLFTFLPRSEILKIAQFYPRDASGRIIEERNMRFNVIGSLYESMTYEASYLFDSRLGSFEPKIVYLKNLTATSIGIDQRFVVSTLGRILGPDRYRIVGSLQWNKGPFSVNLFVYHTPSYLNDYMSRYAAGRLMNPELVTRVSPLTTADLSMSWVATNGLNIQLAGRNILKAKAPFTVVDGLPYDTARYNVAGRTVSINAQLAF